MVDTVRVRASSWSDLFDCPKRWAAKNIDNIYSPSGAAAHIGTCIHASTAVFDQHWMDDDPVSIDDAAEELVQTLHHPEEEVIWLPQDPSIRDAEEIALRLHTKYCSEIAPQQEYTAVEAHCESLIVELDGINIELTGTTDRIRKLEDGSNGISDLKSGKRRVNKAGVVDTKSDGAQLAVYELVAERAIGEPITGAAEIIGLQTTKTGQVAKGAVSNTRNILVGTEEEPGLLEIAGGIIKSGAFYGNPRSVLCSPKYCPVHSDCRWRN